MSKPKNINVDSHFIQETKMLAKIVTPYIKSKDQVGDIFTKVVHKAIFEHLCSTSLALKISMLQLEGKC